MHCVRNNIFLLTVISFLISACSKNSLQTTSDIMVIEVTGESFNWHYRYPGIDGVLGNADDKYSVQNLYLPTNTVIELQLKSNDYIYNFALPELNQKEIAVPNLDFALKFHTGAERTLKILGDQFCGYSHASLIGDAFVREFDQSFYNWPDSKPTS